MDTESLIKRLRAMQGAGWSLRAIGRECEISHEKLRSLTIGKGKNLTSDTFEKILLGLSKNGF